MQTTTRVDYDELTLISKKIHDEGEDCAQLISSTRQKMAALRGEWEGEAADKFFEDMENQLLPAVRRLSQSLIFSRDVLAKIMQTIYEADQETGSFFKDGVTGVDDFGVGMFEQIVDIPGVSGMPGVIGESTGPGTVPGTGPGIGDGGEDPSETTDHFTVTKKEMEPFNTPEAETTTEEETQPTVSAGGGGGGGSSGSGLQGDLKGLGAGLDGQPASNASVGGSSAGAEGLPDHNFGAGGSSGGGSEPASQSNSGGSGSSAGEVAEGTTSSGDVVTAGIAGIAGSAAVGGAAKILKDKQDNNS
jgi:WXG100 family type VII secretion target